MRSNSSSVIQEESHEIPMTAVGHTVGRTIEAHPIPKRSKYRQVLAALFLRSSLSYNPSEKWHMLRTDTATFHYIAVERKVSLAEARKLVLEDCTRIERARQSIFDKEAEEMGWFFSVE